jgi:hypothetical protein
MSIHVIKNQTKSCNDDESLNLDKEANDQMCKSNRYLLYECSKRER